ncbi:MAG: hypothetical protein KDC79_14065 [Cyclobacteriaceae bacterium]|nr:hypothetical protein [Cyclobacteriaceae bacterium]
MNTISKIFMPAVTSVLMLVACGNSKPKLSEGQIKEINEQAQFPDSIKPSETLRFDFENYSANQLPDNWTQYYTGNGGTDWKVMDDNGNKVMAQLYSDNPNSHFNIVVNNNVTAKDMVLTTRLKGVNGNHDQGGGFVWRFTDKNNYYVVRANPLEDNVVLYKVENGKRTDLPIVDKGRTYGVDVPTLGNGWNNLKLVVKGDLFTVFLNGKELFKVQDETFTEAGKVGFWTKADAVTYFDDFEIEKY